MGDRQRGVDSIPMPEARTHGDCLCWIEVCFCAETVMNGRANGDVIGNALSQNQHVFYIPSMMRK
jgi:hypothetical protein